MKIGQQVISSIALALLSTVFSDVPLWDRSEDQSSTYEDTVNPVPSDRKPPKASNNSNG